MRRITKFTIVLTALLVVCAVSSFAVGTNPTYGTAGLFRTFSADTIAADGIASVGFNMFAFHIMAHNRGEDDTYLDIYVMPHMGITIAPFKYGEIAFNGSAGIRYKEPVFETRTFESGLGDMRWAAKINATNQKLTWASLGAMVYMDMSPGTEETSFTSIASEESTSFIAENQANVGVLALASKSFMAKFFNVNFNIGYLIRDGEANKEITMKGIYETIERPDAMTYGIGLDLRPGNRVFSILLELTGEMGGVYKNGSLIDKKDNNLEATLGFRTNGLDFFHMGLGGSYRINKNDGWGPYAGPDYRFFLQGMMDIPVMSGDRDKDGIKDKKDKCPDDPEDYDGFEDKDGCPDLDNDNDGIPDTEDQCPDDAEDRDGFQDEDGCPDPDNDNDGILDIDDKCPNDPENFNGVEDTDGCPDEIEETKAPEVKRFVLEGVKFKPNSAELVAGTYASLEKAGQMLRDYPEINVLIEGHAASTGRPDFEQSLSTERAQSIMKYMVGTYGVDPGRISAKGFGSTMSVADNSTRDGRARNRRIEFVVQ